MCTYHILIEREDIIIKWCSDCNTYNLTYGNLMMQFSEDAIAQFKCNLSDCYEYYLAHTVDWNNRNIFFNTRMDSMQLLFSLNEVSELLSIIQEAELNQLAIL
ncbi:MAG: hypothetical protein MK226_14590 [Saprospiraceae bacterium]|nr:hypothetical protein [Saprospiraceae bacterium]